MINRKIFWKFLRYSLIFLRNKNEREKIWFFLWNDSWWCWKRISWSKTLNAVKKYLHGGKSWFFSCYIVSLRKKLWRSCNPFLAILPFHTLWKHEKNQRFSGVFRRYKMGTQARYGLNETKYSRMNHVKFMIGKCQKMWS